MMVPFIFQFKEAPTDLNKYYTCTQRGKSSKIGKVKTTDEVCEPYRHPSTSLTSE